VTSGTYPGLHICEGDEDYFEITASGSFTVTIQFQHAVGDLDMALYEGASQVAISQGTGNTETITQGAGTYVLRVYGYNGAQGEYGLTLGN
jgi:hypothetical protein